tara:strand:+ start:2413 stop:3312 length:900 start_codon:yes stop_codon:yes gene_type:complete
MKCIVTGGAGFIGSNLVDKLVDDNHEVIVIDNLVSGKKENINSNVTFYELDITEMDVRALYHMFEGVDVVFHLAAMTSVEESIHNPEKYHKVNVVGTLNILKACVDYKVKRFVYTSSSAVYGDAKEIPTSEFTELNPMSPYALNKLMGEQYCKLYSKLYGLETVCLRYANVFGDRQRNEGAYCNVIGIFSRQKSNGEKLTIVGDGEQTRDFINVSDVADANIAVGFDECHLRGAVLNVGSGKSYSVNQIAEWVGGETSNIPPRIEPKESLLDSNQIMECFDWQPKVELSEWLNTYMKEK